MNSGNSTAAGPALETRLRSARRWHIEYGGYLSNHLTHNWVVLALGGADAAALDGWERTYADPAKEQPLEPAWPLAPRSPLPAIDPESLRRLRGCGMERFPALQAAFDVAIATNGRSAVAAASLPPLLPGLAGAAFHPLIHVGLGVEAESDSMVADGLAYWTCVYQPLGSEQAVPLWRPDPHAGPEALIVAITAGLDRARQATLDEEVATAAESPEIRNRDRGTFQHRIMVFADPERAPAAWLDAAGPLALPPQRPLPAEMNQLRHWIAKLLFTSKNEFFVLHGLTSCYALGSLLPLLDSDGQRDAVAAWVQAATATVVAQGFPGLEAEPELPGGQTDADRWAGLRRLSWRSSDEHVSKAVYALWRWHDGSADACHRATFAAAATALVETADGEDPAANLWFAA